MTSIQKRYATAGICALAGGFLLGAAPAIPIAIIPSIALYGVVFYQLNKAFNELDAVAFA
jgi:hypothetical protein